MNQDLKNLETAALVDLLARATERYTTLLSENTVGDEYHECKKTMEILQAEIALRAQKTPEVRG